MLIPVYKPLGISTHRVAQAVGEWANEKATHTGSLDPMAEGVVLVLTGEDRFKKQELANSDKTYQFEILFGVATDSHDLLGLTTKIETEQLSFEKIEKKLVEILPTFIGKQKQTQPAFSSQRVDGKSGFDLAKSGKEFKQRENDIEIFELSLQKIFLKKTSRVKEDILNKILLVDGDFRQKKIVKCWQEIFQILKTQKIDELLIAELKMICSKRTYVRGMVRDISKEMVIPATTFSIIRAKSGEYSISDCEEIPTL